MSVPPADRTSRPAGRSRRPRRRSIALVLVLASAAIVSVVAYAFVAGQGTLAAVGTNIEDRAKAQAIAESGLRLGIRRVHRDLEWRTSLPQGVWVANAALDGGSFTLTATDGADLNGDNVIAQPTESDGDLGDDPADLLTLVSIGRFGGAVVRLTAVVTPQPADGLRILMLVADPDALQDEDAARKLQMERWGWVVTPFSATASPADFLTELGETDVVYVPRLTAAAPAAGDWDFVTSVVSESAGLASPIGFAAGAATAQGGDITIVDGAHEIMTGLSAMGALRTSGSGAVLTGPLAGGARILGTESGEAAVVVVDVGGLLYGSTTPGLTASYLTLASAPSTLASVNWSAAPTATEIVTSINRSSSTAAGWTGGPVDNFAIRYSGVLLVPEAGDWLFATNSDDGSDLWIDGTQVVVNDGLHSMQTRTGTITLTEGSHAFEVRAFERSGSFGIIAYWRSPGATSNTVIPTSAFVAGASPGRRVHLPLGGKQPEQMSAAELTLFRQAMEWAGGTENLQAEYFTGGAPVQLGDVDWSATPVATAEVENINIPDHNGPGWPGGPSDDFGVRFRGYIDIPASGSWTFELRSDDGSDLVLDGSQLIDNDGLHSMRTVTGTRDLQAGRHALEVRAFEHTGQFGVILSWRGPGVTSTTVVPPEAYSGRRQGGFTYAVAYR